LEKIFAVKTNIPNSLIENMSDTVICSEVFYHSVKNKGKEVRIYNRTNPEEIKEIVQHNAKNTSLLIQESEKNHYNLKSLFESLGVEGNNCSVYSVTDSFYRYNLAFEITK